VQVFLFQFLFLEKQLVEAANKKGGWIKKRDIEQKAGMKLL
jgi:hypothetical protein